MHVCCNFLVRTDRWQRLLYFTGVSPCGSRGTHPGGAMSIILRLGRFLEASWALWKYIFIMLILCGVSLSFIFSVLDSSKYPPRVETLHCRFTTVVWPPSWPAGWLSRVVAASTFCWSQSRFWSWLWLWPQTLLPIGSTRVPRESMLNHEDILKLIQNNP